VKPDESKTPGQKAGCLFLGLLENQWAVRKIKTINTAAQETMQVRETITVAMITAMV
jgi:hypothetical protein